MPDPSPIRPTGILSNDPISPDVRPWHGVQRRDWVVIAIMPTLLLAGMTSTFTDLARPFVLSELSSDRYRYQWVIGATLFGSIIGVSLTAWLRSRLGLKRSYVAGLILFTMGSLACGASPNVELLGIARFFQGWGNGLVITTVIGVFWREFPDHRDGAITAYVLGLYFGRIVAPSISGYLINLPSWRTIFFFNVPVGATCVVLTTYILQHDKPREGPHDPFDFEGIVLLLGWVFCLMMGLFRFQKWGWDMANEFWMVTCTGLVLFAWFLAHETTSPHPLLDFRLFRRPRFAKSVAIKALADLNFFAVISLLVRYMAVTRAYERVTTGLVLLPAVLSMTTTLSLCAWLGKRTNRKLRLTFGMVGMTLATWTLSSVDLYTDKIWTGAVAAAWAASVGLVASPLICISQDEMTPEQVTSSASIKNLMLILPAFIGNNLVAIFVERRADSHFEAMRQSFLPNRPPLDDVRRGVVNYYTMQGLGPGEADRQAGSLIGGFTHDFATVLAYQSAFQVLALVLVVGVLLSLSLRYVPHHAPGPRHG